LVFYGLPWLEWGQRQAVLFDLGRAALLYLRPGAVPAGLHLPHRHSGDLRAIACFLFTAVAGRLWCGYACPQTVYTEIFLWLEQTGRRRPLSPHAAATPGPGRCDKLARKSGQAGRCGLALALWTGFTFVGYFTPIHELGA